MADILPYQARPNAAQQTLVVGTAGHIDHGKTALIRALTGVETDRLPEEKKRGITIDLGFASLVLPDHDRSQLRISFIDVPGHARFVRNMLAGAGGIDAVILVISAEEGVKPQTEEHLAICSLLGVQHGLTVLSKIDAVDASRLNETRSSVSKFLASTFLATEPIISVSAFTGEGLDQIRQQLTELAARLPHPKSESLLRLPIDRSFAVKGFGTVITGTLISGVVPIGKELIVEPGARLAKVRNIQVHGQVAERATAPTRVALNLNRVDADLLQRGDTLVAPDTISAVDAVDVEIALLESAPPLKHGMRAHFHAFATECMANVSLYGYQPILPGSHRLARLRLSHPVVLLPGDRFVLRQGSPISTIGGGRVLDAHPIQRLRKKTTEDWLEQMRHIALENTFSLRVGRRGLEGTTSRNLSIETGFTVAFVRDRLQEMHLSGEIHSLKSDLFLSREAMITASALVQKELEKLFAHGEFKRSVLKSKAALKPEVTDAAIEYLERSEKLRVVEDRLLPAKGPPPRSSVDDNKLAQIARAYQLAGLEAPTPADLASTLAIDLTQFRKLVTVLLRERKLVRLGSDSLFMHQDALLNLKGKIQRMRGQSLDVSQFKQLAGVSRKYAIPLLEYLDYERITRREGDRRIVL
ncbi:selenocysteine-specific translation elongation factor [Acidobacteria bacterium AB60]|nr:selenocysteine-specific translation elongation factor [Acidobacteria bacterium AB60]